MIEGIVTDEGEPVITLSIDGSDLQAVIDTGFNGDLQLPLACRDSIPHALAGTESWVLANNEVIEEDSYRIEIQFDGEAAPALVSFVPGEGALIGTNFLRKYRLFIDFAARTVRLERA